MNDLTQRLIEERDALDVLPLSIVPIETPKLRQAKLVKDVNLKGVVEVFHEQGVGQGRVEPERLPDFFGWPKDPVHPDLVLIRSLARLASYDVYTLRVELRRLNIVVDDHAALSLTKKKQAELSEQMRKFTAPLMQEVFGDKMSGPADFKDLIAEFKNPKSKSALANLVTLSEKLDIELDEIPRFLEGFGDVFLSLAYFKSELDRIVPSILSFLESKGSITYCCQFQNDSIFMSISSNIESILNNTVTSITGRFESFERHTESMWTNITAESFKKVRDLIRSHHATVGGVLCGLSVKMRSWDEAFGDLDLDTAIVRRADFIMTYMGQGLASIEKLEMSAS